MIPEEFRSKDGLKKNLPSILSEKYLNSRISPERQAAHFENFSQMTEIENQFLEMTQEILNKEI